MSFICIYVFTLKLNECSQIFKMNPMLPCVLWTLAFWYLLLIFPAYDSTISLFISIINYSASYHGRVSEGEGERDSVRYCVCVKAEECSVANCVWLFVV